MDYSGEQWTILVIKHEVRVVRSLLQAALESS